MAVFLDAAPTMLKKPSREHCGHETQTTKANFETVKLSKRNN